MSRNVCSMRVLALCSVLGAALSSTSLAHGQTALTERLRVQGIYAHQTGQTPPDDLAAQVVPELSLLVLGKRSQLRATYTLTATAHTALSTDIANRVNLVSASELSKRTTLLLSAEAGHSTVTNALIAGSASATPVGAVPLNAGQIVFMRTGEGTSWEASPVVRFNQTVDASYVTTLDAGPQSIDAHLFSALASVERTWKSDAVGVDLRGAYAWSRVAPLPPERLIPLAVTPHWRHDISQTLTSSFVAGAVVVLSTDPGARPLVGPYAQASLNYLLDDATLGLTGSAGTEANALTAQLLYADQVVLRAAAPLSLEHSVAGSTSIGYTHGYIIDRRVGVPHPPDFDTLVADANIGWSPVPPVEVFARYQFIYQLSADNNAGPVTPNFQRHALIVGIQLSSRPDVVRVPTRFPERVDRTDATPPP